MYILVKEGTTSNVPVREYYCDTATDIQNLPSNAPFGSCALIIATGAVYIKNSLGNWVLL